MRHSPLNRKDPSVRADLVARRSRNETPIAIGKAYGVSRQAVNQALAELQVDSDPEVLNSKKQQADERERRLKQQEQDILSLYGQGLCLKAVAKQLHTSDRFVQKILIDNGIDPYSAYLERKLAARERRAALLDSSYGNWSVIPDTCTLVKYQAHVRCRCICGTERLVMIDNLLQGFTTGCGCKSKATGRRRVPWLCTQTGERFENTKDFSRHVGISVTRAQGLARREVTFTAPNGLAYKPLIEHAVPH